MIAINCTADLWALWEVGMKTNVAPVIQVWNGRQLFSAPDVRSALEHVPMHVPMVFLSDVQADHELDVTRLRTIRDSMEPQDDAVAGSSPVTDALKRVQLGQGDAGDNLIVASVSRDDVVHLEFPCVLRREVLAELTDGRAISLADIPAALVDGGGRVRLLP